MEGTDSQREREGLLEGLFGDVTGELDQHALRQLGVDGSTRFYEVLAAHLAAQGEAAEGLVRSFKTVWQYPYITPIFAALLHRWVFLTLGDAGRAAPGRPGSANEKLKYLNVCVVGCKQLMWADLQSEATRFFPVYRFLLQEVLWDPTRLAAVPQDGRAGLLQTMAQFLPYYLEEGGILRALERFPAPDNDRHNVADYVCKYWVGMFNDIKIEGVLASYIGKMKALKGTAALRSLSTISRLRLQERLSSLSSPGGPLYPPRNVRHAAMTTFSELYPEGKHIRGLFRLWASLLHPLQLPGRVIEVLGVRRALAAAAGLRTRLGLLVADAVDTARGIAAGLAHRRRVPAV